MFLMAARNHALRAGDVAIVEEDSALANSDGGRFHRLKGRKGYVMDVSEEGDILADFDGPDELQWVSTLALLEAGMHLTRAISPLCAAVEWGRVDVVRRLLQQGLDVNSHDKDGRTPLMLAHKVSMMHLLLEKGADVHLEDKYGGTALMRAAGVHRHGSADMSRLLVDAGANLNVQDQVKGQTALMHAGHKGRLDVVRLLVQQGAEVNVQDKAGQSALIQALHTGKPHIAKFLVQEGADLDVQDMVGQTALMCVVHKGDVDMARFLVQGGADMNTQDHAGRTVLMQALCAQNQNSMVRLFVQERADVNVQDHAGETALMYAVRNYDSASVSRLLVDAGANLNVQDKAGQTPLMHAARTMNSGVAMLLVQEGADLDLQDHAGMTALIVAVSMTENNYVADLLLKHGADVNLADVDGKTALDYSEEKAAFLKEKASDKASISQRYMYPYMDDPESIAEEYMQMGEEFKLLADSIRQRALALTLHVGEPHESGVVRVTATNMSGDEMADVEVDAGSDVRAVKCAVLQELKNCSQLLRLLLPDGRMLQDSDAIMGLAASAPSSSACQI